MQSFISKPYGSQEPLPERFRCLVMLEKMTAPRLVVSESNCGHVVDKSTFMRHVELHATCPVCRAKLKNPWRLPVNFLADDYKEWKQYIGSENITRLLKERQTHIDELKFSLQEEKNSLDVTKKTLNIFINNARHDIYNLETELIRLNPGCKKTLPMLASFDAKETLNPVSDIKNHPPGFSSYPDLPLPQRFICSVSKKAMKNPVIVVTKERCGHIFDAESLKNKFLCPTCGKGFIRDPIPARFAKEALEDWKRQNIPREKNREIEKLQTELEGVKAEKKKFNLQKKLIQEKWQLRVDRLTQQLKKRQRIQIFANTEIIRERRFNLMASLFEKSKLHRKHTPNMLDLKQVDQDFCDAVRKGNLKKVADCFKQGANLNLAMVQTHSEWPPIFEAISNSHVEVVKFLVDKKINFNVGLQSPYVYKDLEWTLPMGMTPLMFAASCCHGTLNDKNLFAIIFQARNYSLEVRDSLSNTAMHYALSKYNENAAIALINAGAKSYALNQQGLTPLQCAEQDSVYLLGGLSEKKFVEKMRTIISKGLDYKTEVKTSAQKYDEKKAVPVEDLEKQLMQAVKSKDFAKVQVLVKQGANLNKAMIYQDLANKQLTIGSPIDLAGADFEKNKAPASLEILHHLLESKKDVDTQFIHNRLNLCRKNVEAKTADTHVIYDYALSSMIRQDFNQIFTMTPAEQIDTYIKDYRNVSSVKQNMQGCQHEALLAIRSRVLLEWIDELQNQPKEKALFEKLQHELVHHIETISAIKDIKAISYDKDEKKVSYLSVAVHLANRLDNLKEDEEYSFATGWAEHCVNIVFIRKKNTIVIRVDNSEKLYYADEKVARNEKDSNVIPMVLGSIPTNSLRTSNFPYLTSIIEHARTFTGKTIQEGFKNIYGNSLLKELTKCELEPTKMPACTPQAESNCYIKCFEPGLVSRMGRAFADDLLQREINFLKKLQLRLASHKKLPGLDEALGNHMEAVAKGVVTVTKKSPERDVRNTFHFWSSSDAIADPRAFDVGVGVELIASANK